VELPLEEQPGITGVEGWLRGDVSYEHFITAADEASFCLIDFHL